MATYLNAKAHPRTALILPNSLAKAKFKNIRSTINHISPSTIGSERFFYLVRQYTELYSQIAPDIWMDGAKKEIDDWCDRKQFNGDPSLFTSYTVGQKAI